jgi:hypothetical protein
MWIWITLAIALSAVALYDLTQKKHAILRNFPVIGHFRYWLESIGPELRQYIVTGNDEELPFSRDERRWVYASAKRENTYLGFGTDMDIERNGHLILKHDTLPKPYDAAAREQRGWPLPCAKVVGDPEGRAHGELRDQPAQGDHAPVPRLRLAEHPSLVTSDRFEVSDGRYGMTSLLELFGYEREWGRPGAGDVAELREVLSRAIAA